MKGDRNAGRLAKRFAIMFALVAATLGVATLITGRSSSDDLAAPATTRAATTVAESTTSTTSTAVETTAPAVPAASDPPTASTATDASTDPSVSIVRATTRLPEPELLGYCEAALGPGATFSLDVEGRFACGLGGTFADAVAVTEACVAEFGEDSRQVRIRQFPQELRCVPGEASLLGEPDFESYCRATHGSSAEVSAIAPDENGWRCVGLPSGVFVVYEPDFARHEVDWVCQSTFGAETFARAVEPTLDGWRCYEGP